MKVPATGQLLQAKASRCHQLRHCHRPALRPRHQPSVSRSGLAPGDGGQVLPSAIGHQPSAISHQPSAISHRSAGQVLHLVKVPVTGQPLQVKASRCHQLRHCHRPALRPRHQPAVSRSAGQPASRPATMLAPPAQVLPSASGQACHRPSAIGQRSAISHQPSAIGQRVSGSAGQVLHLVKVPATGQRSGLAIGHRPSVSGQRSAVSRSATMLAPPAQAMPPASAQACSW